MSLDALTGGVLFALQWGLAALGIVLKVLHGPMAYRTLSLGLYLTMGLCAVPFGGPVLGALPFEAAALFVVGGLSYLGGLVFYLDERIGWNHLWWHLAVLVGAGCHVVAVAGWILP